MPVLGGGVVWTIFVLMAVLWAAGAVLIYSYLLLAQFTRLGRDRVKRLGRPSTGPR